MSEINLNEVVEEVVDDATVITVPIDDTLSVSGEAADAKAVGDALALKADASAVNQIQVNGQGADNQGLILIDATDIPMSDAVGAPTIAAAISSTQAKTADAIAMSSSDETTVAEKISGIEDALEADEAAMVKSVNGETPDDEGDVTLNTVPYAQNLESESSQTNTGTFIERSTGGEASVESGDAWLTRILGNSVHDDYVAESIQMTVTPASPDSDLAATLDRDTFVAYVEDSGTITLTYTSSWSHTPSDYGITVTGTPASGDVITVVYVKEERGTITVANPQTFVSTGWNLYKHTDGRAKVVKYSDTYGFRVEGTYTALQFSETVNGARSDITVTNGNFSVPSDGYVWVTGGNSASTAIYMTWSDWTEQANGGVFQAYSQTVIDISSVMSSKFPNGLFRVGSVQDEINLNLGQAISRIERMAYSAQNLATAQGSGREYEYDENYIYLVRASATTSSISVNGAYSSDDHGLEYFTTTEVSVGVEVLYGNNLKNKLERDVLTVSVQSLSDAQKSQARANIGAASAADLEALSNQIKNTDFINATSSGRGDIATAELLGCSGTMNEKLSYHYQSTSPNVMVICGRFSITSFVRTAANPGFAITLPQGKKLKKAVNIRSVGYSVSQNEGFRAGELLYCSGAKDANKIMFNTSESYTNMTSGNRAVFIVFPIVVEVY